MMINQKFTSILSAGIILLSFNACAGRPAQGNINFTSLDSDSDGKIALQEFINNAPSMGRSPEFIFSRLDIDENGFISSDEFEQRKQGGGRPEGRRPSE